MTGIRLNTPAPSFDQIRDQFSMAKGGKDHNIRSVQGRGLYTSDKASLSSVKAFFNLGAKLEARAAKREGGVALIRQAIDGQYGKGMSDRVLFNIAQTKGRDLGSGIKRSDLDLIGETADRLLQADKDPLGKFAAARTDPNVTKIIHNLKYDGLRNFIKDNLDVVKSQRFWSTDAARRNVESIASALAMHVLDRIATNGKIEQQDLDDLSMACKPYESDPANRFETEYPPAPPLGEHLIGAADATRMDELTKVVYDQFMKQDAPMALNIDTTDVSKIQTAFTEPHTSDERITIMNAAIRGIDNGRAGIDKINVDIIRESLR